MIFVGKKFCVKFVVEIISGPEEGKLSWSGH